MKPEKLALFEYVHSVGPMYGVEDFSIFLYSLVKMQRPNLLIELGSGSGCCSLMSALAMQEAGQGRVISYDNGSQWSSLSARKQLAMFSPEAHTSYHAFMSSLTNYFHLESHVSYVDHTFPPFPSFDEQIDILFADYESHPAAIAQILCEFVPRMSASASIFIDGVTNYTPSYLFLERTIDEFNRCKIPSYILELLPKSSVSIWIELLHTKRFVLMHIVENKHRIQNCTAWIKLEPVDAVPPKFS